MLILTRRVGEIVNIGDDVTITVTAINGTQVRLGINAPKEVAVHRQEIYDQMRTNAPVGKDAAVIERSGNLAPAKIRLKLPSS